MPYYGQARYGEALYGTGATSVSAVSFYRSFVGREASGSPYVELAWEVPSGVDRVILVRSEKGVPASPEMGTVLTDEMVTTLSDHDVLPNRLYYYSLWIMYETNAYWRRVASVEIRTDGNFNYPARAWDLIPEWYKLADDNKELSRFIGVLGYFFDSVNTSYLERQNPNNLDLVSSGDLVNILRSMGMNDVPPTIRARALAYTLPKILRMKGTYEGLHTLVESLTGLQLDSSYLDGYNEMLTEDQANFAHPLVKYWDRLTWFDPGDRVVNGPRIFEALISNIDVEPQGGGSATWKMVSSFQDSSVLYEHDTQSLASWSLAVSEAEDGSISIPQDNTLPVRMPIQNVEYVRIEKGYTSSDPTAALGNSLILYNPLATSPFVYLLSVPDEILQFSHADHLPNPGSDDVTSGNPAVHHATQAPVYSQIDYVRGAGVPVQGGSRYLCSLYARVLGGRESYDELWNPELSEIPYTTYDEVVADEAVATYRDLVSAGIRQAVMMSVFYDKTGAPISVVYAHEDSPTRPLAYRTYRLNSQWKRQWMSVAAPKEAVYLSVGMLATNIVGSQAMYLDSVQVERDVPQSGGTFQYVVTDTQKVSWSVDTVTAPVESKQDIRWSVARRLDPPPPVPPPVFTPVLDWGITGSNTWRPAVNTRTPYDWRGDTHVFQGNGHISGYLTGNMRGFYFYGTTMLQNIGLALSKGGTLKYATVYLYRPAGNGYNRADPVYLCWHNYRNQPSKSPYPVLHDPTNIGTLRWQEGKYFRLPSKWVEVLVDQAKRAHAGSLGSNEGFGLGFYAASGLPFVQLTGLGGDTGPTVPYMLNPSHAGSDDPVAGTRHVGDPNSGRISVEYWQGRSW